MRVIYQGIYINLARSQKRNEYIKNHLQEIGLLPYFQRFEALDGDTFCPTTGGKVLTFYEKACFSSHLTIMKQLAGQGKHLHIVEDDAYMHKNTKNVLNQALKQEGVSDTWDILYLGLYHPIEESVYRYIRDNQALENSLHLFDVRSVPRSIFGAFSLIIHKDSIAKVVEMLERDLYRTQIDHLYRRYILEGSLRGSSFLPMLAYPRADAFSSNMKNRTIPADLLFSDELFALSLRALFQGTDMREIYDKIIAFTRNNQISTSSQIINPTLSDVLEALKQSAQPVLDKRKAYLTKRDK